MIRIQTFSFNVFQENTYLLYDDSKACAVIDPGCSNDEERDVLFSFIEENQLTPQYLINTHCHIDHVLGNKVVAEKFGLELYAHQGEVSVLASCDMVSNMYGIPYDTSPPISKFIEDGDIIQFGNQEWKALLTPGHSPASLSFYNEKAAALIAGDVLFYGSIGRSDLPGGNYDTLINSVKEKFFTLPDEVTVYPGHGPSTTIGHEKRTNPFF